MAKWMWIIAGPNGAGKSTFSNDLLASAPDLVKLNADERTAELARMLQALRRAGHIPKAEAIRLHGAYLWTKYERG